MTTNHITAGLDSLEQERDDLRGRLARAWELREPMDRIRTIEQKMRNLWERIETAEETVRQSQPTTV